MNCLFCEIVAGRIPSQKVYEDDQFLVFKDIAPQAPVHVLVIPKVHYANVTSLTQSDPQLVSGLFSVITKQASALGVDQSGFRVVTNTGREGGQSVDHVHFHVMGGRPMHWPPG